MSVILTRLRILASKAGRWLARMLSPGSSMISWELICLRPTAPQNCITICERVAGTRLIPIHQEPLLSARPRAESTVTPVLSARTVRSTPTPARPDSGARITQSIVGTNVLAAWVYMPLFPAKGSLESRTTSAPLLLSCPEVVAQSAAVQLESAAVMALARPLARQRPKPRQVAASRQLAAVRKAVAQPQSAHNSKRLHPKVGQ